MKNLPILSIAVLMLGASGLFSPQCVAQAPAVAAASSSTLDISSMVGGWQGMISSGHAAEVRMAFRPDGTAKMTIHFTNGSDAGFHGNLLSDGTLSLQSDLEGLATLHLTLRRREGALTASGLLQQAGVTQPPKVSLVLTRLPALSSASSSIPLMPANAPTVSSGAPITVHTAPTAHSDPQALTQPLPLAQTSTPDHEPTAQTLIARKQEVQRTAHQAIRDAVRLNQVDVGAVEDLQNQIQAKKTQLNEQIDEVNSAAGDAQFMNGQAKKLQAIGKQENNSGLGGLFGGLAHLLQANDRSEASRCQDRIAGLKAEIRQLNRQIKDLQKQPKPLVVAHRFAAAGQWPEAESALREMLSRSPTDPSVHDQLGDSLAHQQEWQDAAVEYKEASRSNANEPVYLDKLGLMLRKQQKYSDAEAAYRVASQLAPDNGTYRNNIGIALYEEGRYKDAEDAFRNAAKSLKDDARVHSNIGNALVKQGQYKDAEGDYKDAIKLDPKNGLYHALLAECLLKRSKRDDAKKEAQQAIQLGCKSHPVFQELGLSQ